MAEQEWTHDSLRPEAQKFEALLTCVEQACSTQDLRLAWRNEGVQVPFDELTQREVRLFADLSYGKLWQLGLDVAADDDRLNPYRTAVEMLQGNDDAYRKHTATRLLTNSFARLLSGLDARSDRLLLAPQVGLQKVVPSPDRVREAALDFAWDPRHEARIWAYETVRTRIVTDVNSPFWGFQVETSKLYASRTLIGIPTGVIYGEQVRALAGDIASLAGNVRLYELGYVPALVTLQRIKAGLPESDQLDTAAGHLQAFVQAVEQDSVW